MEFTQRQIEDMGAVFYLSQQFVTVGCVACREGQVEFEPVGPPRIGNVQIYQLTCDRCGRTGKHPN